MITNSPQKLANFAFSREEQAKLILKGPFWKKCDYVCESALATKEEKATKHLNYYFGLVPVLYYGTHSRPLLTSCSTVFFFLVKYGNLEAAGAEKKTFALFQAVRVREKPWKGGETRSEYIMPSQRSKVV